MEGTGSRLDHLQERTPRLSDGRIERCGSSFARWNFDRVRLHSRRRCGQSNLGDRPKCVCEEVRTRVDRKYAFSNSSQSSVLFQRRQANHIPLHIVHHQAIPLGRRHAPCQRVSASVPIEVGRLVSTFALHVQPVPLQDLGHLHTFHSCVHIGHDHSNRRRPSDSGATAHQRLELAEPARSIHIHRMEV